jgi:Cys-rich repeat protein
MRSRQSLRGRGSAGWPRARLGSRARDAAALMSLTLVACADHAIDLFPQPTADGATVDPSATRDARTPGRDDSATGVGCLSDTDCTPSQARCEPSLHVCVQCIANDDCAGRSRSSCNRETNRCALPCANDADCPSDMVCDPHQGVCVECLDDSQCTDPREGRCTQEECVQCVSAQDCAAGDQCWQFTCVACVTSADCPEGGTCSIDHECR